ncbi:Kelch motif family protein [Tritrichomonas foetus]|uniref:Kelch motif family protein n=1 Tax=Tritrichomonas foetus TaxID=1144522 RepID=A0A1J4KJC2_9EUKA|nr:Kelch motif family protein [Tritrichomonas foetus]|eukprot:OHT11040.1 Kelch motif family protein [Tritrichomonas foetus]
MGNEESTTGAVAIRQLPADMYLPMGGMRMNDEKGKTPAQAESPVTRPHQRTHIVKTAFSGIWSLEDPDSLTIPSSRTGHFSTYCDALKVAVIGLGIGSDGQFYDDIWLLKPLERSWSQLPLNSTNGQISPRSGARATVIGTTLYIFGGSHEPMFYNDLYAVNLENGNIKFVQTTGQVPSPRTYPVLSSHNKEIILWGGYDGTWPSELYILDTETFVWACHPQDIGGRTNIAYDKVGDHIFGYGSAKTGGLLDIDIPNRKVTLQPTTGPEPSAAITDAAFVHFDNYLMFIGGKAASASTLIYAIDLTSFRWFVFHILPDGSTVSAVDGIISDLGFFMLPRTHSVGCIYVPESREIIAFLGFPLKDPSQLFILKVGEALSLLHLRTDMLQTIAPVDPSHP